MANKKSHRLEALEQVVLAQLRQRGPGWVTSREIACEVGYPCPGVARALMRLAATSVVDSTVTSWVSSKSRVRTCFAFRLVELKATYPAWLVPPVHPIAAPGRVIRMKD